MDNLDYDYTGNQLNTVTELTGGSHTRGFKPNSNTTPFEYDDNGNMTNDHYKGISIAYNELNLPKQVSYGNDDAYYYYDAAGIKLRIFVDEATDATVDYVGSFVYENNQLTYITTSFGRILKVSGGFDYEYFATDHLGNIRAVYGENSSGNLEVRQLADYYPFGERHDRIYTGITGSDNNYLFNGKELQSYVGGGFNFYDYGARMYDPILGRWHAKDPMGQYHSPYVYCANNPINMIDPNGMFARMERCPEYPDGSNGGGGPNHDPAEPQYHDYGFRGIDYYQNMRPPEAGYTREQVDEWFSSGARKAGRTLSEFVNGECVDITGNGDWVSTDDIVFSYNGEVSSFGFQELNGTFSMNIETPDGGANIAWNANTRIVTGDAAVVGSRASSGGDKISFTKKFPEGSFAYIDSELDQVVIATPTKYDDGYFSGTGSDGTRYFFRPDKSLHSKALTSNTLIKYNKNGHVKRSITNANSPYNGWAWANYGTDSVPYFSWKRFWREYIGAVAEGERKALIDELWNP